MKQRIGDAWKEAEIERDKIMSDAILNAYAMLAITGHKDDELSEHEAKKLYDAGWIKDRTQRGLLHFSRKGATSKSAKVYSRFEIESLKRAEKRIENKYLLVSKELDRLQKLTEK